MSGYGIIGPFLSQEELDAVHNLHNHVRKVVEVKFLEVFQKKESSWELIGIPISEIEKIVSVENEGQGMKTCVFAGTEIYYSMLQVYDLIGNLNKGIYNGESQYLEDHTMSSEELKELMKKENQ